MPDRTFRDLVSARGLKIGTFIGEFATPGIGQILRSADIDFAFVDLEHTGFTYETLKSILRYLQMCVHSVIVDHMRAAEWAEPEEEVDSHAAASPDVQDQVLDRIQREELWRWLNAHLHDDRERAVVYGTFILDLKPRELYDQHLRLFSGVAEVYRVKQNVLARLRRDPDLESQLR